MDRHLSVSQGSRPHTFSPARAEWAQKRDAADGTHQIGTQWSSTLSWVRAGSRTTSCIATMTRYTEAPHTTLHTLVSRTPSGRQSTDVGGQEDRHYFLFPPLFAVYPSGDQMIPSSALRDSRRDARSGTLHWRDTNALEDLGSGPHTLRSTRCPTPQPLLALSEARLLKTFEVKISLPHLGFRCPL